MEQKLNRVVTVEGMNLALPAKESKADGFMRADEVEKRVGGLGRRELSEDASLESEGPCQGGYE